MYKFSLISSCFLYFLLFAKIILSKINNRSPKTFEKELYGK